MKKFTIKCSGCGTEVIATLKKAIEFKKESDGVEFTCPICNGKGEIDKNTIKNNINKETIRFKPRNYIPLMPLMPSGFDKEAKMCWR